MTTSDLATANSDRPAIAQPQNLNRHEVNRLMAALEKEPLKAAPARLRHSVWRVWVIHSHLMPTPLPLAAAVGMWVREYGLTEDDAAAVLDTMLSPTAIGQHRFAADLMTALATAAAAAIRAAAERKAALDRRAMYAKPDDPAAREKVAEIRDGLLRPVEPESEAGG